MVTAHRTDMEKAVIKTSSDLSELLRNRRHDMGISQGEVSSSNEMSRFTLVDAESGRGDPKLSTMFKLFQAMGLAMVVVPAQMADRISFPEIEEEFSPPDETDDELMIEGL